MCSLRILLVAIFSIITTHSVSTYAQVIEEMPLPPLPDPAKPPTPPTACELQHSYCISQAASVVCHSACEEFRIDEGGARMLCRDHANPGWCVKDTLGNYDFALGRCQELCESDDVTDETLEDYGKCDEALSQCNKEVIKRRNVL